MVLNDVIDDEIIAMQGEEMGIIVSEAEIDALLQVISSPPPSSTPLVPPISQGTGEP